MFTGIITEVGGLHAVRHRAGVTVVHVDAPAIAAGLGIGDSVAVNGVCLTVTGLVGARFSADLSPETIRTTTARRWRAGDRVHLEASLRASDPLGGHFVLGHVDAVGRVERTARLGEARQVTVGAPAAVLAQLLPKGSIAVDGVSLTLDQGPFVRSFTTTLIPETLRSTRLSALRPGDLVNLEVDVLAKAGRRHAAEGRGPQIERRTALTVPDIRKYGWQ